MSFIPRGRKPSENLSTSPNNFCPPKPKSKSEDADTYPYYFVIESYDYVSNSNDRDHTFESRISVGPGIPGESFKISFTNDGLHLSAVSFGAMVLRVLIHISKSADLENRKNEIYRDFNDFLMNIWSYERHEYRDYLRMFNDRNPNVLYSTYINLFNLIDIYIENRGLVQFKNLEELRVHNDWFASNISNDWKRQMFKIDFLNKFQEFRSFAKMLRDDYQNTEVRVRSAWDMHEILEAFKDFDEKYVESIQSEELVFRGKMPGKMIGPVNSPVASTQIRGTSQTREKQNNSHAATTFVQTAPNYTPPLVPQKRPLEEIGNNQQIATPTNANGKRHKH